MSKRCIVMDNGGDTSKVGFAGDEDPEVEIPTVVSGRTVGEAARNMKGVAVTSPVKAGFVKDWDAMEEIWSYIFKGALGVKSEEHPVLLTAPPAESGTRRYRERLAEVFFETFQSPSFLVGTGAVLTMLSWDCSAGVVVDSGSDTTRIVPVYESDVMTHGVKRLDIGGNDLTEHLRNMITKRETEKGNVLPKAANRNVFRDMKEKLCYVALYFDQERQTARTSSALKKKYTLPDGQVIAVNTERFTCPEALFSNQSGGLHDIVKESIDGTDIDMREMMYSNIILTGGNTLFPNLDDRLHRELTELRGTRKKVKVRAPKERKYSAWIGGSAFAEYTELKDRWITKEEYAEEGSAIVYKKYL